jgi:hypothetical protein
MAARRAASCVPVVVVMMMPATDRSPGLPGNAQDDERDDEPDQRVGDLGADRHGGGACDDRQAYVGVCASMVSVGD